MGSYRSRERRSSSFLSLFFGCCSGRSEHDQYYSWDDAGRICPSDEDKGRWVGDRRIDSKATAFIARFHESRVSDPEQYAV
ncbi:hypothetical protein DCAR_0102673 [Daucus carota subsp. sativus]|uniref:Uncharacterized protein n=1 Tax=Daucus carota subsp. sativus TaxID=79200 RepID=A0A169WUX1_DAUCS|nr:hypothetical protein DCAR_0102673 [Daucus carota subsp. sativus]